MFVVSHHFFAHTGFCPLDMSAHCLSYRPAAGRRTREVSSGEEPGAGAGPSADVHHQPRAAAGDRGDVSIQTGGSALQHKQPLLPS